jgi:hypothetical protein
VGWLVAANVLEKHAVSIFRAEELHQNHTTVKTLNLTNFWLVCGLCNSAVSAAEVILC